MVGESVGDAEEADEKADTETMIETESPTGLRLLSYRDWLTWRSRFYTWQRAWIERMHKKATQLIARSDRKRLLAHPLTSPEKSSVTVTPTIGLTGETKADKECITEIPRQPVAVLPDNYCPGTVVEVSVGFVLARAHLNAVRGEGN